jgi:heptosyltransferase-3
LSKARRPEQEQKRVNVDFPLWMIQLLDKEARMHEFKDIKKILVIKLRHIGDVLLSVPVFRALRETFPNAYISAIVNSETEEVLTGNPLIDEVIVFNRNIKKKHAVQKYIKELSFLKAIRGKGFDMTVDLTGGDRAAIISLISGARYRLAYDPERDGFYGKRYLYTHLAKKDGSQHMVMQNLDIVKQFGISTNNLDVYFFIPDDARVSVKKIFEENLSKGGKGGFRDKIVHVHPTSRWLFKCWKDEYMAEVIIWLVEQGVKVIVTSSPDKREMEKAKRILSLIPSRITHHASRLIDLCGKTNIKELAAVSSMSNLFIGVDSAPMHIAAAVGTPVVALFGPTAVNVWGPWDNNYSSELRVKSFEFKNPYTQKNGIQTFSIHTVIQKDWECIPCGKDGCNRSKISKCLEDIKPEEVKNILSEKLKGIKKIWAL